MKNSFLLVLNLFVGLLFSFIGFVNSFWGNDPFYGLAIIILSLIFYLPFVNLILEKVPIRIQTIFKFLIGFFIIWSSLGVGELFKKIELMKSSFPSPKYESFEKNLE